MSSYGLKPKQKKVGQIFLKESRGKNPIIQKALIEAGLVEAELGNPRYGDRDSLGSLQERSGYGSARRRLDPHKAARRFVGEAEQLLAQGFKGSAGQLAQAVQRSGFPKKYDLRAGDADAVLKELRGADSTGGGTRLRVTQRPSFTPAKQTQDVDQAIIDTLAEKHKPGKLAGTVLSKLAYDPQYTTTTPAKSTPGKTERVRERGSSSTATGKRGEFSFSPTANRPGVDVAGIVRYFVSELAGLAGRKLNIGTGTNHDRMTVDGNVSDHWDGHAADIPASGAALIKLGQQALITAGMNPAKARKQTGGLFNLTWHGKRVQVIFNTNKGGNHYDHLHVGVR